MKYQERVIIHFGVPYIIFMEGKTKRRKHRYKAKVCECWQCGEEFWGRDISGKRSLKFCSQICFGRFQSKQYHKRQLVKRCIICRKPFYVRPSDYNKYTTCGDRYCHQQRMRELGQKQFGGQHGNDKTRTDIPESEH